MTTLADDDALEQWASLMGWGDELPDLGGTNLTVNAGLLRCLAVQHPTAKTLPHTVPRPTYTMSDGRLSQSLWFLTVPVDPGPKGSPSGEAAPSRAVNAWRMTESMIIAALGGRVLTEVANPLPVAEGAKWTGKTTSLATMKNTLERAGFAKYRLDHQARSNGGQRMTEAQTQARRTNLVAARQEAQRLAAEKADAKARDLLDLVAAGHTDAEIAAAQHLAPASVRTTLARARKRPGMAAPPPAATGERRLDLDELVEMLSTGEPEPSNVVRLPVPYRTDPANEAYLISEVG